jgi:hypothetical protein
MVYSIYQFQYTVDVHLSLTLIGSNVDLSKWVNLDNFEFG